MLGLAMLGSAVFGSTSAAAQAPSIQPPGFSLGTSQAAAAARLREAVAQAESDKNRIVAEVEGLGTRHAAAEQRLFARSRALYRLTRMGSLTVSNGLLGMLSHLSRLDRLKRMVRSDANSLRDLSRRRSALEAEVSELDRRIDEGKQALTNELASPTTGSDPAVAAAILGHLDQASAADGAMASAAAPAAATNDGLVTYGQLRVLDGESPPAFATMRGRLTVPVSGVADLRWVEREDGPGVELVGRAGVDVRAAAWGTVVYAERYERLGRVIILDHGDEHYTVYAGVGYSEAVVGQVVRQGERLGETATDGVLFFQVRRGTVALDARTWLGF